MNHLMVHHLRGGIEQLLIRHLRIIQAHTKAKHLGNWIKHALSTLNPLCALKLYIFEAEIVQSSLERFENIRLLRIER